MFCKKFPKCFSIANLFFCQGLCIGWEKTNAITNYGLINWMHAKDSRLSRYHLRLKHWHLQIILQTKWWNTLTKFNHPTPFWKLGHKFLTVVRDYLCQMKIILADIQARACDFMIKRIPRGFNFFTKKNKRCEVFLPTPYIGSSYSRGHQTVTIMNLKIYCCHRT